MQPHPLGVLIAIGFLVTLGLTLLWMLRLPQPMPKEVARAVYSVEAARTILVPILELFYSERAVELACRLGRLQNATIVLAYTIEVPRVISLDAPLPKEINERAQKALEHAKQIVERHELKAVTDIVRAREADEGIRRTAKTYQADLIVLGVEFAENRVPSLFTRVVDALLRRPPCELIIDTMPA
ncbi:MAG: universal stress protein [Armatimonadetes bacterium]|nr:universal stress protein [Armatimonadota bacterium]MDW8029544.1 universal stress protein [Armatimonadota bacterium]